jgi:hypothetical protein
MDNATTFKGSQNIFLKQFMKKEQTSSSYHPERHILANGEMETIFNVAEPNYSNTEYVTSVKTRSKLSIDSNIVDFNND